MSVEQEHIKHISSIAADAVAAAMRVTKAEIPEDSEKRQLLLVLVNAAASCGILRIDFDDNEPSGRRLQARLTTTRPSSGSCIV